MELGIIGHKTRGNEVIKILEMLGGNNRYNIRCVLDNHFYHIRYKDIENSYIGPDEIKGYEIFSLEDFLEKNPYRVGDKVNVWINEDCFGGRGYLTDSEIISMRWNSDCCEIAYRLKNIDGEFYKSDIYKSDITGKVNDEENVENSFQDGYEKCKSEKNMNDNNVDLTLKISTCYVLPDGYHFTDENGNVIDATKILIKKNSSPYPKDCDKDEYCEVLGYKIDDVIFTNDTGWIRITKKLWDCYAKEHVYEGIGIINGHEYKDIRHNNVTGKMQLGHLKHCKDVDEERYVNSITDDIMINQITNKVSVIKFKPDVCDNQIELHLGDYEIEVRDGKTYAVKKKPKYPKTYEECCDVLNIPNDERYIDIDVPLDYNKLLSAFTELLICRDAYWKIAGEQMGLGKPWEPAIQDSIWGITRSKDEVEKYSCHFGKTNLLEFPTVEMRDVFYENFKDLIEICKKLL